VINESTRYRIPKEKHGAFLSDYTKAAEHLRASSVCLGYELCQCEEEQDCFACIEEMRHYAPTELRWTRE